MGELLRKSIVVDVGTFSIKAGFAGDDAPTTCLPTVLGKPRQQNLSETYIGEDALNKGGLLTLKHPVERGIVINWDYMEKIYHHLFEIELKTDVKEYPILLTETPLNPKPNRQKMAQVMFETFQVPAMSVQNQGPLSLYASGRTTGLAVAIGEGASHVTPVYEGFAVSDAIHRVDFAGIDVSDYLRQLLHQKGHNLSNKIVKDIKERLCYVATEIDNPLDVSNKSSLLEKSYQLPDGETITIGEECCRCPEVLFQPSLMNRNVEGIQSLIKSSISKCSIDIRSTLYDNVILSGGSSMFDGFADGLKKHLACKVVVPPERKYSVWIGGSILASLSDFQRHFITRKDYDELGPSIV